MSTAIRLDRETNTSDPYATGSASRALSGDAGPYSTHGDIRERIDRVPAPATCLIRQTEWSRLVRVEMTARYQPEHIASVLASIDGIADAAEQNKRLRALLASVSGTLAGATA